MEVGQEVLLTHCPILKREIPNMNHLTCGWQVQEFRIEAKGSRCIGVEVVVIIVQPGDVVTSSISIRVNIAIDELIPK